MLRKTKRNIHSFSKIFPFSWLCWLDSKGGNGHWTPLLQHLEVDKCSVIGRAELAPCLSWWKPIKLDDVGLAWCPRSSMIWVFCLGRFTFLPLFSPSPLALFEPYSGIQQNRAAAHTRAKRGQLRTAAGQAETCVSCTSHQLAESAILGYRNCIIKQQGHIKYRVS